MSRPILEAQGLEKSYDRWSWSRRGKFALHASFRIDEPEIVGVLGPNGAGKTTLFELLAGSCAPSAGRVLCAGHDVHSVKYDERDRLVIHHRALQQMRAKKRTRPNFLLQPARLDYPLVHIFDEPQLGTEDGYLGFMLEFFRQLRQRGSVVLLCMHPRERLHVDILREYCGRFLFVAGGRVTQLSTFSELTAHPGVRDYLGSLAEPEASP